MVDGDTMLILAHQLQSKVRVRIRQVVTLADTLSITFVDQTVEDGGVQHLHHRCAQKVPKEIICVIVSVALNEHAETAAISWCVADRAWFADAPIRSTPFASASAAHSKPPLQSQ